MGLMDKLRNVKQHAGSAAQEGIDRVKHGWEDAERRLRQRMRVYPKLRLVRGVKSGNSAIGSDMPESGITAIPMEPGLLNMEELEVSTRHPRASIVSINGRDLDADDVGRKTA